MGATEVHGRYSCFCFISTPKHIPIHYHTVDGCEILHQLVDGLSSYNPIIYTVSCFIVTNSYPGWWFGFRVAIHSLGCHAALENYCQSKRSKPFCLRFRSQGFVRSRHDSGISKEELAVLSRLRYSSRIFFVRILTFPEGTPWQERLCGTLARPVVEFTFNRATPVRGGIHLLVGQSWWNICKIWTLACELTKTRMFIHSFGSRHVCWVLCLIEVADPNTTFWVGSIS